MHQTQFNLLLFQENEKLVLSTAGPEVLFPLPYAKKKKRVGEGLTVAVTVPLYH